MYDDNKKFNRSHKDKKNKGQKHRKHYDVNEDYQKNKQYKIRKQNLQESYEEEDIEDNDIS